MSGDRVAASEREVQETQFLSPAFVDDTLDNEATDQEQQRQDGRVESTGDIEHRRSHGTAQSDTNDPKSPPKPFSTRAVAPDLLRGFVMVLQAIDHCALMSGAWPHGQSVASESASTVVRQWNGSVAYTARTLTHLCAPGFMFLLGMGIVYFGRSRSKLGWTPRQMCRHFAVRCGAIIAVNQVLTVVVEGRYLYILNVVLLALAFNYLITGLLWLGINWSEPRLTDLITKATSSPPRGSETDRLLPPDQPPRPAPPTNPTKPAFGVSFHIHNLLLLSLCIVTAWWNIWLDPHHGHCPPPSHHPLHPPPHPPSLLYSFWFHPISTSHVSSAFPPLAWLSPCILGLLYARLASHPFFTRRPSALHLATLLAGLIFLSLFVSTRTGHWGNLSEDCIRVAPRGTNQYLASPQSFFYVVKYPPSPAFLLLTLGGNLVVLAGFGVLGANTLVGVLLPFGTSALFFYALHLPLYAALGGLVTALFGRKLVFEPGDGRQGGRVVMWGVGDGWVFWGTWVVGLVVLWPCCRWYAGFKRRKGVDSIWRFF